MRALRSLFSSRRPIEREDSSIRRVMQIWAETGTVPVAHMVAELDWTTEHPASG